MKKLIFTGTILGTLALAAPAFAATRASFTPSTITVTAGQSFNVVVSVDPQGNANYAEKVEVNYPADLLTVTSFTLGNSWMALSQPGYDSIDNINGVLVKTAGYTGGITGTTAFGTITFKAKKSGDASITIGAGSQAFESAGQTSMSGAGASVAIKAASETKTNAAATVAAPDLTPVTTVAGTVIPNENAQTAAAQTALQNISTSHRTNTILAIGIPVAVIIGGVYFFIKRRKTVSY